jgi:hypothetical protein
LLERVPALSHRHDVEAEVDDVEVEVHDVQVEVS